MTRNVDDKKLWLLKDEIKKEVEKFVQWQNFA